MRTHAVIYTTHKTLEPDMPMEIFTHTQKNTHTQMHKHANLKGMAKGYPKKTRKKRCFF